MRNRDEGLDIRAPNLIGVVAVSAKVSIAIADSIFQQNEEGGVKIAVGCSLVFFKG